MSPAREVVKIAQKLAEDTGFPWSADGFRSDPHGFWEKKARKLLFDGKTKAEAAQMLYESAVSAELK